MPRRFVFSLATIALGVTVALGSLDTTAQQRRSDGAASFVAPKTPWGDPDIQGLWPSGDWRRVPLQRPENLGTRNELTPQEFDYCAKLVDLFLDQKLPDLGDEPIHVPRRSPGIAAEEIKLEPERGAPSLSRAMGPRTDA